MAAPAPSPAAASSSSSSSSSPSGVSTIGPPECPICTETFECDEAADVTVCRLPRTLPCTHSVCSACLIKLVAATPGRVKCPTCRADHALKRPPGVASPAAYVRLIPQNADIVQLIRRSAQLEAALQEQQWVQVQHHSSPRCACSPNCAEPAVRWCDDCDSAWCAAHDAATHRHAWVAHRRMTLSEKEAVRQTKVAAMLAAAGAGVKASARITVQQQQSVVERLEAEAAEQQHAADEKRRQLDEARARLAEIQESAARLQGLSDTEVHQQCGSFAGLLYFPPGASGLLVSLSGQQLGHLCRFLGGDRMPAVRLLYRATRDGFSAADFWRCCADKGPTLTLVKVAGNGFVCGAFTPLSWPADAATRLGFVADPSGRTFLFSLINAHGRAVKLRLKDGHREKALALCGYSSGPGFGDGIDLLLISDKVADGPRGCYTKPQSFELDDETETAAGLPPIPFSYDQALLTGNDEKGESWVCFAAAEIEVYQL